MQRHTCIALVTATALMASCAGPATSTGPRTAARSEPRAEPRRTTPPLHSPQKLVDTVMACMTRLKKADDAHMKALVPIIESKNPPTYADAMAGLSGTKNALRDNRKDIANLSPPTDEIGQKLLSALQRYHKLFEKRIDSFPRQLRSIYDDKKPRQQRLEKFVLFLRTHFKTVAANEKSLEKLFHKYRKQHGIREPQNPWLAQALALHKAACACTNVSCAKLQQANLNDYMEATKGVRVKKADALKVAKAVVAASTCISKVIIAEKLKGAKSTP